MKQENNIARYVPLYMPWLFSLLFAYAPIASYFIAWLGSFFIFYLTLTGKVKPLPQDRVLAEQFMRPIFIVQIIFAGYTCCTSIFYFLNLLGYEYFTKTNFLLINQDVLGLTAQCQRYYCLGHAAFVTGILVFMKYPVQQKYSVEKSRLTNLLLIIALISFPVSILFLYVPGLSQFYFQLSSLSFIAGTLALAFSLPQQKVANTVICIILYIFNFYQALTSGFKEPIIISVLVLGIFLYPSYKKTVTIVFVPVIILMFVFLPTFVSNFRNNAWGNDESANQSTEMAFDATFNTANEDGENNNNWGFLVFRLSEIDMFTRYVYSTPKSVDYYGLTLLKQSAITMIPRIFWPSKPVTEELVMQRVYDAGVVNKSSNVSAKPAFIVDAYLSYGTIGIFIFLFAYGALAQIIACKAEEMFGGYILGTALIFSGLFQIFWRGLSFEFMFNSVFWSYITMLVIFKILLSKNILTSV